MTRAPRRSAWPFRRPRVEEEVDTELAFHVDMVIQMLIADGMTPDAARAEAVRRFGDMAVVGAECRRLGRQRDRSRSRAEYFDELRQDVVFAVRQLGRARAFTATAAITLALGIGATAAVFSALYAVVLQPLPFTDPDRVVEIMPTRRGAPTYIGSGAEYSAIRERRDAFSDVAAGVLGGAFTLTGTETPEIIGGGRVSANYFRVLGVTPMLGRGFLESDDAPGAPRVVLASYRLWQNRFVGDPTLLGRTLRLEDESYTVVGVLPPAFDTRDADEDLWAPLQLSTEQLNNNNGSYLRLVGRLAPNVTPAQASDAAATAVRQVAERSHRVATVGAVARPYIEGVVGGLRERLLVLFGAVGFVLLIACVNVANLLFARGSVRARELAIRAALGAGRGRLIRQLLVESLVLSLGAAVLGVALAYGLSKGLVALGPADTPRLDQARVNLLVLGFTLGTAVVTSVVVGLLPAIRSATPALQSALRDGGRGTVGGGTRDGVRAVLVAAEVALAMTLLTGAGLLIRSAWHLQRVNPGFTTTGVMSARLLLPAARYGEPERVVRTYEQVIEAATRVPGVRRAALVSEVPLAGGVLGSRVAPEGRPYTDDERVSVDIRYASPGYFATMGMSLRTGRDFERTDVMGAPNAVIISESLARTLWPGETPIGRALNGLPGERGKPDRFTVIGVVSDVHNAALNAPPVPTAYMPFMQTAAGMWTATARSLVLVVRTAGATKTMVEPLRQAVMSVDATLPLTDVNTMDALRASSMATARFNTLLLTTLGILALVLAAVGVYGVVTYFVSQRTREIGVRVAFGATPQHIWALILGRGLRPIVWGTIAGTALSLATGRLLRGQLFGVSADDPVTLVAVGAALMTVAVVATLVPAFRALRITPTRALMAE
ncbi:MAG TPA: ABC transporter permease [Gemmatimonadaceae bacterium]|nr:ABC transporter permease [Gemmatimonadaceae bacterium]